MWNYVKLLAFLLCLWPVFAIAGGQLMKSHARSPRQMTTEELRASMKQPKGFDWALIPMGLSVLASVVLLADALSREYDAPKAWPVAIAIVGVLSFGMLSVLYYILWGWMPSRQENVRAQAFCQNCLDATTDSSPGNISTFNGMGMRLVGESQRCETCGSKIKTLWLVFLVPLVPLGSYRWLRIGDAGFTKSNFIARKSKLYWPHVWPHLAVYMIGLGVLVYFAVTQ